MFARISRSWQLMNESWHVLRQDKELILFPVLSSLACVLVMASFVLPIALSPTVRDYLLKSVSVEPADKAAAGQVEPLDNRGNVAAQPRAAERQFGDRRAGGRLPRDGWQDDGPKQFRFESKQIVPALLAFAFYLVTTFVIVFFNTALVCCAMVRFNGGNPSLASGISAAMSRLPQIFGWVLLSATVGTILKAIEERMPLVGKFVVSLIGMAWAAVTFMVVPILAAERLGPLSAVKRSAGLLRKTWGEALVGQVSLGLVQFLFILPAIGGVIAAIVAAVSLDSLWIFLVALAIAVIYIVLLSIVFSTLQQIFLAAVYQYAAQGAAPAGFSQDLIESAFKQKAKKE